MSEGKAIQAMEQEAAQMREFAGVVATYQRELREQGIREQFAEMLVFDYVQKTHTMMRTIRPPDAH